MTDSQYRVGVIGCGGIAQVHGKVLTGLPETKLTACLDIKPERAAKYAETFGCTPFTDMDAFLSVPLDAVHLCTPHCLHAPMAAAIAARGIPVFTEKPPAMNRQQWQSVLESAKKVPMGVCFQNRFNPNVQAAQALLADGGMGKVLGVRAVMTWHRDEHYYSDDWHGTWEKEGGGALINQAVHTLDLMMRFLGKPDQVGATMANHHLKGCMEVEDTAEIWVRSEDRTGLLYATTAYIADESPFVEVRTENGLLRLENGLLWITKDGQTECRSFAQEETLGKAYWGNGHYICIREFYRCLREGTAFRNAPETCQNTMEVLLQAYEQCRETI